VKKKGSFDSSEKVKVMEKEMGMAIWHCYCNCYLTIEMCYKISVAENLTNCLDDGEGEKTELL